MRILLYLLLVGQAQSFTSLSSLRSVHHNYHDFALSSKSSNDENNSSSSSSSTRKISRIGVLCSGGDCPSLNACLRAIYKSATQNDIEVIGLPRGFPGLLLDPPLQIICDKDTFGSPMMLTKGGSKLGGSVGSDYKLIDSLSLDEKASRISAALQNLSIDGIIATGGDTSMNLISQMLQHADQDSPIPFIGIPKSIDNDIPATIYSLGFQSAVTTASQAIAAVRDTAESHRRVIVVECMGRDAGYLTLHAGIAGGADTILIPEIPFDNETLLQHVSNVYKENQCAVIAVSEASSLPDSGKAAYYTTADGKSRLGGSAEVIARYISESLELDARHVVLGHVQRGGPPNAFDQVLASTLGAHAVKAICEGHDQKMVNWNGSGVELLSLEQVRNVPPKSIGPDYPELVAAVQMGIYCGEISESDS